MNSATKISMSTKAGEFTSIMNSENIKQALAANKAAETAAKQLKTQGRAAIAAAGFSPRFQNAFRVNIYGATRSINVALFAFDKIPYAGIFAHGGKISGSPLLWLPLPTAPKKAGGRRVTAGNYEELVGAPLFSIQRSGKPPLLAANVSASAAAKGGSFTPAQLRSGARNLRRGQAHKGFTGKAPVRLSTKVVPLFVGIPKVQIRQRFNLASVYLAAKKTLVSNYIENLRRG